VRHLHAIGHQRIAYLGGTPGWLDSEERLAGFRNAMSELGLPVVENWVRACSFALAHDTGREAVSAVLASGRQAPTAFVCASDEIAAGVYAAATRWGKRIPEDFSVVGFDDNQWCQFMNPSLTTVRHSGFDLGVRVGQLALKLVGQSRLTVHDDVLETSLVVRGSTAPPSPAK
jgi:DNA-binding LacI/PurR family transcriptional regulator